jgi:hypothetical protein
MVNTWYRDSVKTADLAVQGYNLSTIAANGQETVSA